MYSQPFLLKNNQKKEIRFQKDDVILYEPNKAQLDELKIIITENIGLNSSVVN